MDMISQGLSEGWRVGRSILIVGVGALIIIVAMRAAPIILNYLDAKRDEVY